jgi:Fic family protein
VETTSRTNIQEPLGRRESRVWPVDPSAFGSRKARKGGPYAVFIPARIAKRPFPLEGDAVAATAEASKALATLAGTSSRLASLEVLARNVLRSESVASSRIEGLAISHKRLARAVYAGAKRGGDRRAAEVIGNVDAMTRAVELGAAGGRFKIDDILDVHRTLLRHTDDKEIAGVIRDAQNWIGGNDFNPVGADYVPPPPEQVEGLLQDLCRFIERDDLAPVAQAAIAHAQFENIHPFADGNGRTGRALIYTILRRRGEIGSFIPPISLVLATVPKAYVGGLGAYSTGRVGVWCERLASATVRAAAAAQRLAEAVEQLQEEWLKRLGNPRRDAAVRAIVTQLPAYPVIDVAAGKRLTDKSHVAVGNAISQLVDAGVLVPLNERKWGRVWECDELLDLVDALEKSVGTG